MKCILSHTAACIWYLRHVAPRSVGERASRATITGAGAPDAKLADYLRWYLDLRDVSLDLLVDTQAAQRRSRAVRTHVCRRALPSGSLIAIPSGTDEVELYITCPELTYLQMARGTSLVQEVYVGMALCSEYRLDSVAAGGVVVRAGDDRPPTSPTRIRAYVERTAGVPGRRRAGKALSYVRERSRSPKESWLALFYGLPAYYGGMNLGAVTLNPLIEVYRGRDRYGERISEMRSPDILITRTDADGVRHDVAFDYDADSTHAGDRKRLLDRRRANSIATVGQLTHFSIATEDLGDLAYLIRLGDQACKVLGGRVAPAVHGARNSADARLRIAEFERRQRELWDEFVRTSPGY